MRIVFLLSSLTLSGGVLLVLEYAERLTQRGHEVALVVPRGAMDAGLLAMLDGRVRVVEAKRGLPSRPSPFALARLAWSLTRAVPEAHVILATHTPTTLPTLLASLRHRSACRAWLFMDYPEMFRRRPLERALLRWAPALFSLILPISRPLAEAVRPLTRGRVQVVTPGLPRAGLYFTRAPGAAERQGEVRLLYVGDDRPRKGLADFLAAAHLVAQRIPYVRLVIVSKQPCAVESDLPVEFHLQPSHAELAELYRSSHLYVSTSWGEGLGYPPLEAMACGVPVVLTDSEGVRDYAEDGVNCLVAPPRNPDALAQAIMRVLEEPELARRLAANGLLTARRYDWDAATEKLEGLLVGCKNAR